MGNTPYKTAAHFAVPIVLRCTKEKLGMAQVQNMFCVLYRCVDVMGNHDDGDSHIFIDLPDQLV